ncbi:unnamed protein product [Vitrella brassicaformis CCMP3155]|uniref:TLDc domain-containing protein n=1 Tax=Vitrella brassicaformis (strain CCMP3155) TaxID=1169540 RepID=A0A0G4EF15_VITBC|nr:unnamed protein product [Vitrella brassicaformis CCMP3155]|eukprot:CEL94308.1 unnamed protein product [Vitrella brassicaformis CCMP3155]
MWCVQYDIQTTADHQRVACTLSQRALRARAISRGSCIHKNYYAVKLLEHEKARQANTTPEQTQTEGRNAPIRQVSDYEGSVLSVEERRGLLGLLGGRNKRLQSLYRANRDGSSYASLLGRVGNSTRLVFVAKKDQHIFGVFMNDRMKRALGLDFIVPATIRRCTQWLPMSLVPEGYMGVREGTYATFGGSSSFMADELEVLQVV